MLGYKILAAATFLLALAPARPVGDDWQSETTSTAYVTVTAPKHPYSTHSSDNEVVSTTKTSDCEESSSTPVTSHSSSLTSIITVPSSHSSVITSTSSEPPTTWTTVITTEGSTVTTGCVITTQTFEEFTTVFTTYCPLPSTTTHSIETPSSVPPHSSVVPPPASSKSILSESSPAVPVVSSTYPPPFSVTSGTSTSVIKTVTPVSSTKVGSSWSGSPPVFTAVPGNGTSIHTLPSGSSVAIETNLHAGAAGLNVGLQSTYAFVLALMVAFA
ncbi:hypothetical protein KL925_001139 [Ogataea polymorpha]|uniref:Uncharacterized protein n=1 Tax=Ogataea polymorpha TaxID=460523 RepID=A0A9P8PEU7_9ASCO|nr:hypothetical protein KL936_001138 [Ogataea polymorpha]KAG7928958.1 hypothetical protein KL925_001139 [Ogataea polymorpha]KAH3669987.1 hypothetical protein OGATHE_002800 [Ogataea polymorpha]